MLEIEWAQTEGGVLIIFMQSVFDTLTNFIVVAQFSSLQQPLLIVMILSFLESRTLYGDKIEPTKADKDGR